MHRRCCFRFMQVPSGDSQQQNHVPTASPPCVRERLVVSICSIKNNSDLSRLELMTTVSNPPMRARLIVLSKENKSTGHQPETILSFETMTNNTGNPNQVGSLTTPPSPVVYRTTKPTSDCRASVTVNTSLIPVQQKSALFFNAQRKSCMACR